MKTTTSFTVRKINSGARGGILAKILEQFLLLPLFKEIHGILETPANPDDLLIENYRSFSSSGYIVTTESIKVGTSEGKQEPYPSDCPLLLNGESLPKFIQFQHARTAKASLAIASKYLSMGYQGSISVCGLERGHEKENWGIWCTVCDFKISFGCNEEFGGTEKHLTAILEWCKKNVCLEEVP